MCILADFHYEVRPTAHRPRDEKAQYYEFRIVNRRTQQSWKIYRRYNDFYDLRKRLMDAMWCRMNFHRSACEGRCWATRSYIDITYPRKTPRFFVLNAQTLVNKRAAMFQEFLRTVSAYVADDKFQKCASGYRQSLEVISAFLGVATSREERVRNAMAKLREVSTVSEEDLLSEASSSADVCPVCLGRWHDSFFDDEEEEEMEKHDEGRPEEESCCHRRPGEVLELPCHHRFHVHCIGQWFEKDDELQCPVCRAGVVPVVSP